MTGDVRLSDGYALVVCACEGGAYLGARKAGTPCCCERCGFITQDQLDAIVADRLAAERERARADALREAGQLVRDHVFGLVDAERVASFLDARAARIARTPA